MQSYLCRIASIMLLGAPSITRFRNPFGVQSANTLTAYLKKGLHSDAEVFDSDSIQTLTSSLLFVTLFSYYENEERCNLDNNEMEDMRFLESLWNAIEEDAGEYGPDDYEVNQEQMDRFTDAYSVMHQIAQANDGTIDPIRFSTLTRNGEIVVHCPVLDLMGSDKLDFCKAVAVSSVTSIEAVREGDVRITMVIPRVLQLKSNPG